MKNGLYTILHKIVQEQSIGILDKTRQCKALLKDYAKGGFKREIHLILQSLEAGCHRELLRAEDPDLIKPILIRKLQDDYGIKRDFAEETIGLLGIIIQERELTDEEKTAQLEKNAKKGDYRSQYALGLFFKTLKKYETAMYWFEMAAEQSITRYERLKNTCPSPSIPNNFVYIPGGTFIMGSPYSECGRQDNETPHEVLVKDFYMGKYAVTQESYHTLLGVNPSEFQGANLPVERVSWFDAVYYCNALSEREGRSPAYCIDGEAVQWNRRALGYRLPTEAEWEYACRAGTTAPFYTGGDITTDQGNYNGKFPYNSQAKEGVFREKTVPVDTFAPNPWGLYDMHGNVWEWCWNWYKAYDAESQTDPAAADSGTERVCRGGSWSCLSEKLRSAQRGLKLPSYRAFDLGFRLLLPVDFTVSLSTGR